MFCDLFDVTAGFFGSDDIFMRAKLRHGLRQNVQSGTAGRVVDDDRGIHRVRNREVMPHKPCLRGFVIVGRDDQKPSTPIASTGHQWRCDMVLTITTTGHR